MTYRAYTLVAAGGLNLLLALFLAWRYGSQRIQRSTAYLVAAIGGYSLFLAGLAWAPGQAEAELWLRSTAAASYLLVYAAFRFCCMLAQVEQRPWARVFSAVFLLFAVVDASGRLAGLIPVHLLPLEGQGWFPAPEDKVYFYIYVPLSLGVVLSGLAALVWRWKRSRSSLEASQIGYLFMGLALMVAASFCNLFPLLAPLAAFAPLVFTGTLAYGMTQQHILEMRLIVREGAVAALVALVLGSAVAGVLLLGIRLPAKEGNGTTAVMLAAVMLTLVQPILRKGISRALERWLGAEQLPVSQLLLGYSLLSHQHPRLVDFFTATAQRLVEQLGLDKACLMLPDRNGDLKVFASHPPEAYQDAQGVAGSGGLAAWLAAGQRSFDLDSLAWTRRYEIGKGSDLNEAEAEARSLLEGTLSFAGFALRGNGRLLGVLLVGPPRSGRGLRHGEKGFLEALASQLAMEAQNASLFGQVQHADRLSSLGAMAAGLAHELRNPLASISMFVQMLPQKHADAAFREKFLRLVTQELQKLTHLTEQLLNLAKPATRAPGVVDLGTLCHRMEQLLGVQFKKMDVQLLLDCPEGVLVQGVEEELSQVILNLLLNALDVSRQGSQVWLKLGTQGSTAVLRIQDQGPGLSPTQLDRVFAPFFTTKEHGTGLGLATSRRVVENDGGTLSVHNHSAGGAEFVVELPRAKQAGLDKG